MNTKVIFRAYFSLHVMKKQILNLTNTFYCTAKFRMYKYSYKLGENIPTRIAWIIHDERTNKVVCVQKDRMYITLKVGVYNRRDFRGMVSLLWCCLLKSMQPLYIFVIG